MMTQLRMAGLALVIIAGSAWAADTKDKLLADQRREHFQAADKNSDGKLSADEFAAMEPPHGPRSFADLDANGDGRIERGELPRGEGHDAPPPQAERDGHERPPHDPEAMFRAADTNGDGAVDQGEFEAHHAKMKAQAFERMDQNKDGFLQLDELRPPDGAKHHGQRGGKS